MVVIISKYGTPSSYAVAGCSARHHDITTSALEITMAGMAGRVMIVENFEDLQKKPTTIRSSCSYPVWAATTGIKQRLVLV